MSKIGSIVLRSTRFFHIRSAIAFLLTVLILNLLLGDVFAQVRHSIINTFQTFDATMDLGETAAKNAERNISGQ